MRIEMLYFSDYYRLLYKIIRGPLVNLVRAKSFKVKLPLTGSGFSSLLGEQFDETYCFSADAAHSQRSNKIVVALYNYTARESTDVSFMKGDRMEVLDDSEPDWWRVLHLTTLQEGLIPWNFVAVERSVESEE